MSHMYLGKQRYCPSILYTIFGSSLLIIVLHLRRSSLMTGRDKHKVQFVDNSQHRTNELIVDQLVNESQLLQIVLLQTQALCAAGRKEKIINQVILFEGN